jgi:hypothetical protein
MARFFGRVVVAKTLLLWAAGLFRKRGNAQLFQKAAFHM